MDAATASLTVPPIIESVIRKFDAAELFDEHEVSSELAAARKSLTNLTETESSGAWSEVLAFALASDAESFSPWGTYFGPIGSMKKDDGTTIYFPDIAGTPAYVLEHWTNRANTVRHPVLKARYADLVWELSRVIASVNPDHRMARVAIDAYLASATPAARSEVQDQFQAAIRALNLAETLRDAERIESARKTVLQLHAADHAANAGHWWRAFDRLIGDRNSGMTSAEEVQLVADMEATLTRLSDTSNPKTFDPNSAKDASDRLVRYYNAAKKTEEPARLQKVVASSFEYAASLADPMLAAAFLQTAVTAYRNARLPDESKRVRVLMEKRIEASHAQMQPYTFEMQVTKEDMAKFLDSVVTDKIASTFACIASAFLHSREKLEEQVQDQLKKSPLAAMLSQSVMAEKRVAAIIGSIEDDPFGRVIQHAARVISLDELWLLNALDRATEVHGLTPHNFASWVAQSGLYNDLQLLLEGFTAWSAGDFVKAIHVLTPQFEAGLRAMTEKLGRPVTKAHPKIRGASVAVNMGDMLSMKEVVDALGPDTTLHFVTLYSDPRGFNLRNDMAHGLLEPNAMNAAVAARILHSFLVLGVWHQIAKART